MWDSARREVRSVERVTDRSYSGLKQGANACGNEDLRGLCSTQPCFPYITRSSIAAGSIVIYRCLIVSNDVSES